MMTGTMDYILVGNFKRDFTFQLIKKSTEFQL